MRWVVAFFFALVFVPVAQVTADAWTGRRGPHVLEFQSHIGNGPDLAKTHHNRPYDPFAPWFPKTG